MSPSDESGMISIVIVSWYALTTHTDADALMPRSFAIVGSATLAIVTSIIDSSVPSAVTTTAYRRCGSGRPSSYTALGCGSEADPPAKALHERDQREQQGD